VGRVRTNPCKKCQRAGFDHIGLTCGYCSSPLSSRHEHDHFPVPVRHGGEDVIPVCVNCHDLKDRINLDEWDFLAVWRSITEAPVEVKLLYAKVIAAWLDINAEKEAAA
jgi:hypothetical protein